MNKQQLKKVTYVKLWPQAKRIDDVTGAELKPLEDRFRIDWRQTPFISLSRTGHGLDLPYDHIREFMADASGETEGYLILKAQLHLSGCRAWFNPLPVSH